MVKRKGLFAQWSNSLRTPILAILSYRATLLPWCNLSLEELLMRCPRNTVPQTSRQLIPQWTYLSEYKQLNRDYKTRQKDILTDNTEFVTCHLSLMMQRCGYPQTVPQGLGMFSLRHQPRDHMWLPLPQVKYARIVVN